jgi:hypothetical protein
LSHAEVIATTERIEKDFAHFVHKLLEALD